MKNIIHLLILFFIGIVEGTVFYNLNTPLSSPLSVNQTSAAIGLSSWTNLDALIPTSLSSNHAYAEINPPPKTTTIFLYNFTNPSPISFNSNSVIIEGIRVDLYMGEHGCGKVEVVVNLQKPNGEVSSSETASYTSGSKTKVPFGSESYTWGTSWTATELENNQFGVLFYAQSSSPASCGNGNVKAFFGEVEVSYSLPVNITSINPSNTMNLGGGGNTTITGETFISLEGSTPECRFGSEITTANIINSNSIQCPIPPQSQYGPYPVSISLNGSLWTNETINFTYICDIQTVCNNHGNCSSTGNPCICDSGWTGSSCNLSTTTGIAETTTISSASSGISSSSSTSNTIGNSPKENNSATIVAIVIPILIVLILGILIAFFILRRNRKKNERIFHHPDYNQIVYGKYLTPLYEWNGKEEDLQPLIELLLDLPVALSVCNITAATEKDKVAKAMVFFFVSYNKHTTLMKSLIETEVKSCKGETTIFRNNSLAVAFFQVYSKIVGIQYLWDSLGIFLTELNILTSNPESGKQRPSSAATSLLNESLELEIDPSKLEDGSSFGVNKYTLLLTCQKLLQSTMQSKIPVAIKDILRFVSETVVAQFPNYKYKAIGSFLFLRFIVPAISAPHVYGIYKDPPNDPTQRKLVLLSKVLQNLANEAQFGNKEPYMATLNDFLVQNLESLHNFFDKISEPTIESQEDIIIPETVRINALQYLHSFVDINQNKIIADLQITNELNAQKFRKVISSLPSPSTPKESNF